MSRRIRARAQRGQALAELALLLPILVGFFALTLQGGLVISDQVNLQHYAYEGAQWAVTNRTTASTSAIATHIQNQMCGSGNAINTPTAVSRYCRDNTLNISVGTTNATATRAGWSPPLSLLPVNAEAASGCKQWDLTTSPASSPSSPISVAQGGSTSVTLGMTAPGGSGSTPLANLSVTGLPGYLSNGTPQFNPPTITNLGTTTTSTISIAPSINTDTQSGTPYELRFEGIDQCGGTPTSGYRSVWIRVTNGGGPGTVSLPLDLHLDGVFPLCIPTGSASNLTLHGVNFTAGASVVIGAGSSALTGTVTATTSTSMSVTIPAPPTAGVYDATVTLGDGTSYTLANAVTVAASCGAVTPAPGTSSTATTPCSAGAPGVATEYTVTITWTEKLIIPWITSNVGLTARQKAFCQ